MTKDLSRVTNNFTVQNDVWTKSDNKNLFSHPPAEGGGFCAHTKSEFNTCVCEPAELCDTKTSLNANQGSLCALHLRDVEP